MRFPSGQKVMRRFRVDRPVSALYNVARCTLRSEGVLPLPLFLLVTTFPRWELRDPQVTLGEAKLQNGSLTVDLL
jgi:hypothetical protein